MIIKNQIIDTDAPLLDALNKIEFNADGFVVCVNHLNQCEGILTDGDVRRALILNCDNPLNQLTVAEVMNKKFHFRFIDEKPNIVDKNKIKFLPILDRNKRLVKIDMLDGSFWVGDRLISDSSAPFVIGEIGNNHNGDFELAKELVLALRDAGANSAKFQMRNMETLYAKNFGSGYDDLATEYTKDLLSKFQLSTKQLLYLFEFTRDLGMIPICTPWDEESLEVLYNADLPAYKIASADMNNHQLIAKVINTNKPLICSTGMSLEREVIELVDFLDASHAEYALLHCNSTYPTPFTHVNLEYLKRLKSLTSAPIGYSGHERDIFVSVAACALGARIIERHITMDPNMEGADHKASLVPSEFKRMIEGIGQIDQALGSKNPRVMSQAEMLNRHNLSKSLAAKVDIKAGQQLHRDLITLRSPGTGIKPTDVDKYLGKKVRSDIFEGSLLLPKHFKKGVHNKVSFQTENKIGIPVRYHDYLEMSELAEFNFYEFHLTYKDIDLDPEKFFNPQKANYLTIHAPELFENDHLMNLASVNIAYREKSIDHYKRTIDAVVKLKETFGLKKKVPLIVNCGGFSKKGFMNDYEKNVATEALYSSVNRLDKSEIVFCAQTMPPFPWHFGGQQFHNLMRTPEEINAFCEVTDQHVCLDTSHTMMSAKYFGFSFFDCLKNISSSVKHIHLADSKGVDEEGVLLGQGDLQLNALSEVIKSHYKNTPIILETWQGHLNQGENFLKDLNTWLNVAS